MTTLPNAALRQQLLELRILKRVSLFFHKLQGPALPVIRFGVQLPPGSPGNIRSRASLCWTQTTGAPASLALAGQGEDFRQQHFGLIYGALLVNIACWTSMTSSAVRCGAAGIGLCCSFLVLLGGVLLLMGFVGGFLTWRAFASARRRVS